MVAAAALFGALQMTAALIPVFWLFAALMLPIGIMGLTFNVTANSSVQLAADPAMRGRVMSLFMMVFVGGTPIGGPLMGWITDAYGAQVGFLSGGLISLLSAVAVGFALSRAAGLRPRVQGWRVTFVPREAVRESTPGAPQDDPREAPKDSAREIPCESQPVRKSDLALAAPRAESGA